MRYSDEQLSAYLDGELLPEERQEIDQAGRTDADVAARLKELQQTDEMVRRAAASIDDRPLPAAVQALLEEPAGGADNVVSLAERRSARPALGWVSALAASIALVVGFGAGSQFGTDDTATSPLRMTGPVADGSPLFNVLEDGVSATDHALDDDLSVRPVATFKAQSGQYCREFDIFAPDAATRAVACRTDGAWRVTIAIAGTASSGSTGTYTPATGGTEAALDRYLNALIDGAALGAEEEAALIRKNWQD